MPDTQISDEMRLAAREAFKKCRPVERVVCQDFGMQQDDILDQQLEAAITAALAGHVVVPKAALAWLFGEAPDADGKWFGDCEDDVKPIAGRYKRTYWWRSKFSELLRASQHGGEDAATPPAGQEPPRGET